MREPEVAQSALDAALAAARAEGYEQGQQEMQSRAAHELNVSSKLAGKLRESKCLHEQANRIARLPIRPWQEKQQ